MGKSQHFGSKMWDFDVKCGNFGQKCGIWGQNGGIWGELAGFWGNNVGFWCEMGEIGVGYLEYQGHLVNNPDRMELLCL